MALALYNQEDSPTYAAWAELDKTDVWIVQQGSQQTGVISGMAVTQDSGSDMKVAVASGSVEVGGTEYTYSGTGSPFTVAAASTADRWDLVVYRAGTGIVVIEGTPCLLTGANWITTSTQLPPVKPAHTLSTDVVLAAIYVGYNTTTITTTQNVVDRRNVIVASSPGVLPISGGGTGETTASSALEALGGFPVFNVQYYGALGDGSTNDSTACTTAITDCGAAGGGIVYFPPPSVSYYLGSAGLTIDDSYVGLLGAFSWITVANNTTIAPVSFGGNTVGCWMDGFQVMMNTVGGIGTATSVATNGVLTGTGFTSADVGCVVTGGNLPAPLNPGGNPAIVQWTSAGTYVAGQVVAGPNVSSSFRGDYYFCATGSSGRTTAPNADPTYWTPVCLYVGTYTNSTTVTLSTAPAYQITPTLTSGQAGSGTFVVYPTGASGSNTTVGVQVGGSANTPTPPSPGGVYQCAIRNVDIYNFQTGLSYGRGTHNVYSVPAQNVFVSAYPFVNPFGFAATQITAFGYGGMPSATGGYGGGIKWGADVVGIEGGGGPNCVVNFLGQIGNVTVAYDNVVGAWGGDLDISDIQADGCSIGYHYDGSGVAAGNGLLNNCGDNWFLNFTMDQCISPIVVENTRQSQGGMITVDNAWAATMAPAYGGTGLGGYITVSNAAGVRVNNCEILINEYGAFNSLPSGNVGVYLDHSTDCSVSNCIIDGGWFAGIYVHGSTFISALGNNIKYAVGYSAASSGIYVDDYSSNLTFGSNTIRGSLIYSITATSTGGTATLTYNGTTTATLTFTDNGTTGPVNAAAAQAALRAINGLDQAYVTYGPAGFYIFWIPSNDGNVLTYTNVTGSGNLAWAPDTSVILPVGITYSQASNVTMVGNVVDTAATVTAGTSETSTTNVIASGNIGIPDTSSNEDFLPVFDVTNYGATGNGTTNDYTFCNNALAACEAAGGGIVYFPPPSSSYYFGPDGLVVNESYVGLWGAYSMITVDNNSTVDPVHFSGNTTGCWMDGFQIMMLPTVPTGTISSVATTGVLTGTGFSAANVGSVVTGGDLPTPINPGGNPTIVQWTSGGTYTAGAGGDRAERGGQFPGRLLPVRHREHRAHDSASSRPHVLDPGLSLRRHLHQRYDHDAVHFALVPDHPHPDQRADGGVGMAHSPDRSKWFKHHSRRARRGQRGQ